MELYDPQVIRAIKNRYGFRFKKSLGQNFLTDRSVLEAMAEGAGVCRDDLVIEIGPGIGVLTRKLAERAGKVVCIEIDDGFVEILKETLAGLDNVKVVHKDVLKTDIKALIEEEKGELAGVKIQGNLPYYITTPVIMHLLEQDLPCESITIMMQKEVADRIKASPGGRTFGALSVAVQYRCQVTEICPVGKECFVPSPKVDSEVLRLDLLEEPAVKVKDEKMLFRLVKAGFGQRRKTLLNSLSGGGFDKELVRDALAEASVDDRRRAETLTLEEFGRISDILSQR